VYLPVYQTPAALKPSPLTLADWARAYDDIPTYDADIRSIDTWLV